MNSKLGELYKRLVFTLLMILVFRIGSYIPIVGVDARALEELTRQNQSGILGMFNVLSGGSLGRMSIFALGIVPYITSSIVLQLFSIIYKPFDALKKEGEVGRKKLNQYSRYLTIFLATFQSYGIAAGLLGTITNSGSVVIIPALLFKFAAVTTLVVGTIFLMWLGEQITSRGIGNGSSIIIFVGIVSGIPSGIISTFELIRKGTISYPLGLFIILTVLFLVMFVIFFERALRKIPIHYPKHRVGAMVSQDTSYIPLKLNTSGVIAPMFASSLLLFPVTILNLSGQGSGIAQWISYNLSHGRPLFIGLYCMLIVFFCFFYTTVVFNSEEVSNNLKKYSAIVPGKRPGSSTAEYFDYVLERITSIGALYICFVCVLPEILMNKLTVSFALGGTSMLIVVNVVIDTLSQIQSYSFSKKYENAVRKIKIKH